MGEENEDDLLEQIKHANVDLLQNPNVKLFGVLKRLNDIDLKARLDQEKEALQEQQQPA